MNLDIATLLENHRRHMLTIVSEQEYDNEDQLAASRFAIMTAHDRATTKSLLDIYRTTNGQQPVGQAAPPSPVVIARSRKLKAGSKAARERALKAGETRRKNLEAKRREETEKDSGAQGSPATVGGGQ